MLNSAIESCSSTPLILYFNCNQIVIISWNGVCTLYIGFEAMLESIHYSAKDISDIFKCIVLYADLEIQAIYWLDASGICRLQVEGKGLSIFWAVDIRT